MSPLRILVVDDHGDSASALARLLRHAGHDVRTSESVADAFRQALSDPPDVIVSDLDLTDGDGCELLRRIRLLHPRVRGIAVSGYVGEQYERQCREAGYETLLAKPLAFEQVLAAVRGVSADGASADGAAPNRRVLLVEDDHANRFALGHMLKTFGLEVVEVATAAEAIACLASEPSFLVLDWLIPGGGDAVLRHVKDHHLATRVVVVTVAYEERREEILRLGPDALVQKPFEGADVRRALGV